MTGDPDAVPVLRSLPDPDGLLDLVRRHWPQVAAERVVLLRSLVNDVYRVDVRGDDGPRPGHVLKVYRHSHRSLRDVRWEVALTGHLLGCGIPVPAVTDRAAGGAVAVLAAPEGPRPVTLSRFLPGRAPGEQSAALYSEYGRLVARWHNAADSFPGPHRRLADPLDAVPTILARLRAEGHDRAYDAVRDLADAAAARLGRLAALPAGQGPVRGIRHGDVTLDNILVTDGPEARLTIIDFDLAEEGWTAADLYGVRSTGYWPDFAAAYAALRPLRPADHDALPWFTVLSQFRNLVFHLVDKPAWRGTESYREGWLDSLLGELCRGAAALR
ncbi:MAG: phosphotransferase [Actinocatenispora sp.]